MNCTGMTKVPLHASRNKRKVLVTAEVSTYRGMVVPVLARMCMRERKYSCIHCCPYHNDTDHK